MFDLHLVAQAAAPPVQVTPLWQIVIGVVTVILAVAGIAWRAGRTLATKDDLRPMAEMVTKDDLAALKAENEKAHAGIAENVKENRRQIQNLDTTMRSIDRSLVFLSGRRHEQDRREDRDWAVERGARGQGDSQIN